MTTMRRLVALVGVAMAAGAAQAEVLEITGEFAAPNRAASMLESVTVGRIGGQDGPALALAIERALTGTHFQVLAGRTGRANAEGTIDGAVSTAVDERPFKKQEKKCVQKDANGKCVKEEQVEITCRRRVIEVNADLRMVDNGDGRIVYSESRPIRDEISWCPGGRPNRSVEEAVSAAIRDLAFSVRRDIAPRVETYRIRLRESTKGLSKDAAKRFKALVKQSVRDPRGACAGWEAMNREAPGNASILFDLGLCAEQRGDFDEALGLYRDARRAGASEAAEGEGRAQGLIAGREDARERARRRRS